MPPPHILELNECCEATKVLQAEVAILKQEVVVLKQQVAVLMAAENPA